MNREKTNLPSLRNKEWRTIKTETNKINQVLHYITTNNITELNELIYAGTKLLYGKIGISSKSTKKTSNAEKKSTKTGQNDKTKDAGICRNKKEKTSKCTKYHMK